MTDSKDNTETGAGMDARFEDFAAYALDALDSDDERRAVESLIDSDPEALAEFNELFETAGLLAIAVPPVSPPSHLKANILKLAAEDSAPTTIQSAPAILRPAFWGTRIFRSGVAVSATAAIAVLLVVGALGYQNSQLSDEIDTLRTDISVEAVAVATLQSELSTTVTDSETKVASMKSDLEAMEHEFGATTEKVVQQEEMVSKLAIANDALRQALRDQSWLTYVAMKEGYQVESWLAGSQQAPAQSEASGLIAVKVVGNEAVFQVHSLDQPRPGFAYTLWLMGNGAPRPVAQFEVSEIGTATVPFLLPAPLHYYSSVMVTQEQVNEIGNDPSGTMVIFAETN